MKKLITHTFSLILLFLSLLLLPEEIYAGEVMEGNCSWSLINEKSESVPPAFFINKGFGSYNNKVGITVGNLSAGEQYKIHAACGGLLQPCIDWGASYLPADSSGSLSTTSSFAFYHVDNDIYLMVDDLRSSVNPICKYHIPPTDWLKEKTPLPDVNCALEVQPSRLLDMNTNLKIVGTITKNSADNDINCLDDLGLPICTLKISGTKTTEYTNFIINNSASPKTFSINLGTGYSEGNYFPEANIFIKPKGSLSLIPIKCSLGFNVPNGMPACADPNYCTEEYNCNNPGPYFGSCPVKQVCCIPPTPTPPFYCGGCARNEDCSGQCKICPHCPEEPSIPPLPSLAQLCDQLPEGEARGECWKCNDKGEIWSAIGCLPTDFGDLLKEKIFPIGIGFAGGIAFLYFLYGTFIIMTSAGNPEKISEAKEIIISSLSGLLLIIFSVFLLRVIGVDILKIPGFG